MIYALALVVVLAYTSARYAVTKTSGLFCVSTGIYLLSVGNYLAGGVILTTGGLIILVFQAVNRIK